MKNIVYLIIIFIVPVILYAHNEFYRRNPNNACRMIEVTASDNTNILKWQSYYHIPIFVDWSYDFPFMEISSSVAQDKYVNAIMNWNLFANYELFEMQPVVGNDVFVRFANSTTLFPNSTILYAYSPAIMENIDGIDFYVTAWENDPCQETNKSTWILLNNTSGKPFTWRTDTYWGTLSDACLEYTITHELGHVLGLAHCSYRYPNTIMNADPPVGDFAAPNPKTYDIQGVNILRGLVTGIEDYISVQSDGHPFNINQTYVGCITSQFIDNWPQGDYIVSWDPLQIKALSNCGEILVCEGPINIPPFSNGYFWKRDANGYVLAKAYKGGTDNDGIHHIGSTPILIAGVPNTFVTSGTLTSNTYWCGDITITGNIIVPSGLSLTVNPSAVIKFANSASLIVNGKLYASGCTFTSQSGTDNSSWGNITFDGSGTSDSYIRNSVIKYGTRIEAINCSNIEINGCTILNSYDGIRFSGSTGSILNNRITTNSLGHGIIVENSSTAKCYQNKLTKTSITKSGVGIIYRGGSSGYIWQNDISGWDWGIGAIYSSSPHFCTNPITSQTRSNRITNCRYGLNIYNNSYPVIGVPVPGYGYNTVFNNTYKQVAFSSGGIVDMWTTYWGGGAPNPSTMFELGSGSSITYNNWLSSNPWQGISKIITGEIASSENVVPNESDNLVMNYTPINYNEETLYYGIELIDEEKYKEAKDFFLKYIAKHPEDQSAYVELFNCYTEDTSDEIIKFFSSLPKKAAKEQKLLLSYLYLKKGDYETAKKVNNNLISENSNSKLAANAKINNIYISLYNENNLKEAVDVFNDIIKRPELSSYLELSLVRQAIESSAKTKGIESISLSEVPKISDDPVYNGLSVISDKYLLLGSFPNPFNPATSIRYNLPQNSKVLIEVFSILGEKVAELVNEVKNSGFYEANFDGSNLSSGIYIYRLTAQSLETGEQFVKSAKMMLIK